jgi:DcaP outer membrane protein
MRCSLRSILPTLVGLAFAFPLPATAQSGDVSTGEGVSSNQTLPSPTDDSGQRWKLKFYGFVELDAIHDSTQSFLEASLNAPIFPRGTYQGDNGRTQFTAKNSRIGLIMVAPTFHGIEASGNINFDFFGLQPTEVTENDYNVVGTMRLRHAYLRLRTPVVDFLAGQHPTLFGWGGAGFYPGTVAFLGTVGQVYHHDAQARLSKTLGQTFQVETAVAAVRPAQRDSEIPDIEGGIRLAHNGWRGRTIQGNDRPEIVPLSLGLSGMWRHFSVMEYREIPRRPRKTTGWGAALNAFLPIIPASSETDFTNCLTVTGEFSVGSGVADRYSFLTGGAKFPSLPNPTGLAIPPLFMPNIDSGLVTYDPEENLKTINWRAFVVGAQYYLPLEALRVWVTGLYANLESDNLKDLTPLMNHGGIFTKAQYVDGSLFVGITPDVHVGASVQVTEQERANNTKPRNIRVHAATNLFF